MPLRSNPFLASIQELIPGQKRIIEDRQFEGIRTMPMYIMMFLSMASPILHDSYLLAWYIDLFSTLGFMVTVVLTHPEEIKKYGPVVLPTGGLLSVIVFAGRVSLLEIMPWIPFSISMWLLITVYSFPALLSLIEEVIQGSRQGLSKHSRCSHKFAPDIEEDQSRSSSFDFKQNKLSKSRSKSQIDRDTAYMDHPASIISTSSSDIDLDEGNANCKLVAARFLSYLHGYDAGFIDSPQEELHSQLIPMYCPKLPEDSLMSHYSTTGATDQDYT